MLVHLFKIAIPLGLKKVGLGFGSRAVVGIWFGVKVGAGKG